MLVSCSGCASDFDEDGGSIIVTAAMSAIVPVVNLSGLVKNHICKVRLHLITAAAFALLIDALNAIARTSFDIEKTFLICCGNLCCS